MFTQYDKKLLQPNYNTSKLVICFCICKINTIDSPFKIFIKKYLLTNTCTISIHLNIIIIKSLWYCTLRVKSTVSTKHWLWTEHPGPASIVHESSSNFSPLTSRKTLCSVHRRWHVLSSLHKRAQLCTHDRYMHNIYRQSFLGSKIQWYTALVLLWFLGIRARRIF